MKYLLAIIVIACVFALLVATSMTYEWLRKKWNRPRIGGIELFLVKLLRRGDYVSINGKILCFSYVCRKGEDILLPSFDHLILSGGELAFDDPYSLGHKIYNASCLRQCEFIYGKYGLKWAANQSIASAAKDKVYNYIWK